MKKILLFVSIVFLTLFSNKTNAQTIDSLIVSTYIECPGNSGVIDVYITNATPSVDYSIILQKTDALNAFQSSSQAQWLLNTQANFHQFTGLSQGLYRVLLVDPNCSSPYNTAFTLPVDPCIYSDFLMPLSDPVIMQLTASDDTLDCWYDTDATLTVDVIGYTQSYFLSLQDDLGNIISGPTSLGPTGTSHNFPNLSSGTYTIFGTDTFSCPTVSITYEIVAPDTIIPGNITIDSITCFDANDGQLTINPTGGTTPPALIIEWYDVATGLVVATGNSTNNILSPGQYYALITDDNGCDTISDTITLLNPLELLATTTHTNPICFGDNNGSITITIDSVLQGKGAPFQYTQNGGANWINFPPLTPTDVTLPALPAGIYTNIRVRDVDGCEYNLPPDTLIEPDLLEFSISALSYNGFGVSCNGVCDAQITIDSVWGGNLPPYGYSSSYYGGVLLADTFIVDSCADINPYTYIVTDSLGCQGTNSITIIEPPVFSISATALPNPSGYDVSCPNTCDGEVVITPTNGVDSINYFYSTPSMWFGGGFSPNPDTVFGVCGNYWNSSDSLFIAIDANGCTDTTSVILTSPPVLQVDSINAINENCALSNGLAGIVVSGGTPQIFPLPPYNHFWSGPFGNLVVLPVTSYPNNDTITGLQYGWYFDSIVDASGCYIIDSVLVDSASILVDIEVLVPCNDSSGVITVNSINNLQLTAIVWADNANLNTPIQIDSNFTTSTLAGITPGMYWFEIQLTGCDVYRDSVVVGLGVTMDATLDVLNSDLNLTCFGDSTSQIEIKVFDTFVDGSGNPLIGSPLNNSYGANLSGGLFNTFVSNNAPFNVLYNPAPLPGSVSYVPAGTYSVIISSNLPEHANCLDTVDVTVTQPDSLQFTLASTPTSCNGGSNGTASILTISGGTLNYNYTWTDLAGNFITNNPTANLLSAGFYILSVTDDNGCTPAVDTIEVFEPAVISYTVDTLSISICSYLNATGQFVITSTGGVGIHTYNWWNSDNSWNTTVANPNGLNSDWYYFIVTDGNLCVTQTDSVFMPNGVDPILDQSFVNNVSCFGVADGNYIAVVDSMNPLGSSAFPFAFWNPTLTPPAYDPSYVPQNPMTDTVTIVIQIQDAIGCQSSDTIFITQPDLLEITHFDTLTYIGGYNISCNGSLDGEIIINTIGGTPLYTYWVQDTSTIHPSTINDTISGLAAAYYKAFVIDDHGCLDSMEIVLTQPDSLLIDSFLINTYIGGDNVSCNGFDDGQANVYVSGGNTAYSYSWSNGDWTDTSYALVAGIHSVIVTDPNGCIDSASITLTEPTPLVIDNFTTTDLLCKGGDRGNATVFVSGATPGYTYLWNNANDTIPTYVNPNDTVPSMNDTTAFADTLRAGWYSVEIWDTNGCYIIGSVELTEPSISVTIDSLIIVQMTCFSYNNASVDILATGPQPIPYLYSIYDEFNPSTIISQGNIGLTAGLQSGNYVTKVEDNLGCLDRDSFIIDPLDSVYIDTIVFNNISCNGFNDGYIQNITAMGGAAPYEYSIDGGPKFSSWLCNINPNTCPTGFVFSGLSPGNYDVEVWDANGCANSYKITIEEPAQMLVSISTNNYYNYQILCYGDTDSAFVNISGGAAPYTLNYGSTTLPATYTGQFKASGISVGLTTFTITDDNSCTYIEDISFNQPPSISFNTIVTQVYCTGSCTGEITAVVSGGVGQGNGNNYTYLWSSITNPTITGTSYNINSLCPGDYTIEATDANGCSNQLTTTIGSNVLSVDPSSSTVIDVNCFADCDGSITVDVNGGVPSTTGSAYTYLWNDPLAQTTKTATGLCAGLYTCVITDMAGCVVSYTFTVNEPLIALDADILVTTPIACNGQTGTLSVLITGGTTPIASYLWSDGTTGITTTGIAGAYTCFVEDNNGCTDTAHFNFIEPTILEIVTSAIIITDVDCKGNSTGEIQVTASGGTRIPGIPDGFYDYKLFDMNGILITSVTNVLSVEFIGLSTGSYFVTVTDHYGCTYSTSNMFIAEPANPLSITIDSYDETCNLNDAYAIVYPSGGTPTYTFNWDNSAATSNAQQSLSSGANTSHTVIVTDMNDCSVTETITLLGYQNVFLPGNFQSIESTVCLGTTIFLDIEEKPNLTYVWENGYTQADRSVTPTNPINIYSLTITDPSCANSYTVTATINVGAVDPLPSTSPLPENGAYATIVKGESIDIFSNNMNCNTYEWTWLDRTVGTRTITDMPDASGWYYIEVDSLGCLGFDSIYVVVGVKPYDAITPNGDGFNDVWNVLDIASYPNAVVQIFNRWGALVHETSGGSGYVAWDGTKEGKELPVGTYYYIIDLKTDDEPQSGPITIIR